MKNTLISIVLIVLLCSCKTIPVMNEELIFNIDKNHSFKLLPSYILDKPRELHQMIHARYGDEEYFLQAFIRTTRDIIQISAFSLLGTTLFELQYDNLSLRFSGNNTIPQEAGLYILADFQLSYYPEIQLDEIFDDSGLTFHVIPQEQGWIRTIYLGDQLLIRITRKERKLEFQNYVRNYEYTIEEVDIR